MIAAAVLLSVLGSGSPAGHSEATVSTSPLVIFFDRRRDLTVERATLSLASACQDVRPVKILARTQGRFDWVSPEGEVQERLAGADLYSALSKAFHEAGWGGDVLYLGTHLPLGASSTFVREVTRSSISRVTDSLAGQDFGDTTYEFLDMPRPSYRFKRSLKDLRESGATFHALTFRFLPDEGMTLLARESGGSVWKAGAQPRVPAEVFDRLCGR